MRRLFVLVIVAALLLSACAPLTTVPEPTPTPTPAPAEPTPEPTLVNGTLQAYFFDVGQADATLLLGPDFTVLIDAGDYRRNDVVSHLKSVGVQKIDLLIGTHPHADHIGQFPQVLATFPVKEVWLSGDTHTTRTFERALDAILASDAAYHEPRAGELFRFGSLHAEVLNPDHLTGDFHEGSVSIRAVFGDIAFIFTGDAETHTEFGMIGRGHNLKAHLLQLGHHGSRTSSSREFLDAVQPEVAIYSAGEDNSYGHPHDEVVNRILAMGIQLYGTDIHGTIVVETDGKTYNVRSDWVGDIRAPPSTDPEPEEPTWVDNGCAPGQISINTASLEELQRIIHIGPVRAQELISLRPFASLDDLTRISGIGPSRLADIKAQGLACVGSQSEMHPKVSSDSAPGQININTASLEELQRIIHIGPVRAQELISLRPFASLDDLTRISGIGPSRLADIKAQGLACVGD